MKRASALLSWWFLAIGGAIGVAGITMPTLTRDIVAIIALGLIAPVVMIARRWHEITNGFVTAVATAGTCLAGSLALAHDGPLHESPAAIALALLSFSAIIAGLGTVLRQNMPGSGAILLGDTAVVAMGSWIAGWEVVVHPIVDRDGNTSATTVLYSLHPAMTAVMVFLATLVVFGRRQRRAGGWLMVGGLGSICGGVILLLLVDAGHLPGGAERWTALPFTVGGFAACAGFLHPTFSDPGAPQTNRRHDSLGRLIVTTSSLVFPVIVLAGTAPHSFNDRIIRILSSTALAIVVTLRVVQAVKDTNRSQKELRRGAMTDPLTGLPNRSLLLERINDLLLTSWNQDVQPTLFFVDLDRFKNINDSLGHAAGDEVLVKVARRLSNEAPPGATVARLSGDEYVVFDPASPSAAASTALGEQLLAIFREPLVLSHGDVFITASIGVTAISATSSTSPEDLVRHADTAMYRAKDAGRNCIAVYDESMHERVAHRLTVETALYRALDRRELRLYHQPILDIRSGEVSGFEALMRWQQSDGTIVSPIEFIPIAEDTGTIVPIGSWALLEALTQLRHWIDDGVCGRAATMSVNVSPRQLGDANFPSIVSEALTRSGVSPHLLWLEVTESMMISEPELALATLRRLRSLGVRVALDDFGTGYSSLSLLQKFPLQRIKIDRAFVRGVADNPNDRSLVRTIVAMGRSLDLDMVAEGVETVHQLQVLSDLGCSKAQGYLISHPVPADAMRSTVAALERLGQFPGLRPNIDAAAG